ncbi:DMT family transporter [Corallococcus interemptor]|uniref:DMT family transporter n=2 Tax=Corallococcus TaxID=83461 RepID=A0A3A8PP56_9BACT|nr:DMT family transporter [Corallococcus interemptor]RKH44693.1 DMT family transporter [Corallococcus sp. AB050B]RKH58133.1 DMT family transporter [Corallococcus interemptor]
MGASATGAVTPPLGRVYSALALQVLISAGTYLAAKRAMTELSPFTVVLWRFLVCGVAFVALLVLTPGPKLPPRHAWPRVVVLGLMGGPVNQTLFFSGLSRSTAAHAALFYALTPLGVYVASLVLGRERASTRTTAGILTALVGVVVLLLGRGLASARGTLEGDLLILAAVVAWVVYTTEGKPLATEHGPLRATAWTMTVATLLQLPLAPFVLEPEAVWASSAMAKASIVYVGLMTSVVAYLLWSYALSKVPASRVAIFSNLQPAVTALVAWLFLDEALHWELALGGALVLVGVRLTQGAPVKPAPVVVRAG